MRTEELRILIYLYKDLDELSPEVASLVEKAMEATERAYAPYSQFRVGAALELENGEIVTGNNQENIAFPSGLCAERVALFYAGSQYPGVAVKRIALAAFADGRYVAKPIYPCGDCRQVLLEHENRVSKPVEVIMYGKDEIKVVKSIKDLMPLPFDYNLAP